MADETNSGATTGEPLKPGATRAAPAENVGAAPLQAGETNANAADGDETRRFSAQSLKDEAGKIGTKAADQFRTYAVDGKDKAAGGLDEFSRLMRDAAGSVDDKLGEQYGQYARGAADSIANLAESIRTREVDELLEDARQLVRKSPAVAIGLAAGVGFVVARLIQSGIDSAGTDNRQA